MSLLLAKAAPMLPMENMNALMIHIQSDTGVGAPCATICPARSTNAVRDTLPWDLVLHSLIRLVQNQPLQARTDPASH